MNYTNVIISSGHGKYVRGASCIIDEVDEARKVVNSVAEMLESRGCNVKVFHDDTSKTQSENLNRIVAFHNDHVRDLDVSVHFNAYVETPKAMGTEVLYLTQPDLAGKMSGAIAGAGGFINRGAKKRSDLAFLNGTEEPAILIEVCFVDSETDTNLYDMHFGAIVDAIAYTISGEGTDPNQPDEVGEGSFHAQGKCSYFGGPDDMGVSPDEGLAFISEISQNPYLFLPYQPDGTTGLARRLNPCVHYVACRWNYEETPREMLREEVALVRVDMGEYVIEMTAFPADWGPHEKTGRVADLSPSLLADLGIETDDEVEVIFPYYKD